MTEQPITYKTAVCAQQKGFNEPCRAMYFPEEELVTGLTKTNLEIIGNQSGSAYSAPSQSVLQQWFRKKHGIHIEIMLTDEHPYNQFYYRLMTIGKYFVLSYDGIYSDTYEESLEIALQKALTELSIPILMAFTKEDHKPLKKAYDKAVSEENDQFEYKGMPIVTSYAKYLLEYMETLT